MTVTEMKPLRPLDHGNVLIVGAKASNFDEEMRTHPRIIMWGSQNEHWTDKDIPQNVRAIFVTRWIGHAEFKNILAEARKKHITIFNPMGTGIIARQVKELLASPVVVPTVESTVRPTIAVPPTPTIITETETIVGTKPGKLKPLYKFIDFSKGNNEIAELMMAEATRLNISTTRASLLQLIVVKRRKAGAFRKPSVVKALKQKNENVDVSVQILDEMIKGLTDMRQFLVDTVNENMTLKAKMANFKKLMEI